MNINTGIAGCAIPEGQVSNSRPKCGTGTPKHIWVAKQKRQYMSYKSKYSWIAKTNSDGTLNFFPISCPEL